MANKKDEILDKLIKETNLLERLKEMSNDPSCFALIPTYVMDDMESFLGEPIFFIGIAS